VPDGFHAKVVGIVADVERIRGLRLLHPVTYYIISDNEAKRMGLEDPGKTKAFYNDNTVYFLEKNLVGDWDVLAAHEFVHALQDQNFGLDNIPVPDKNRDAALAVKGLIEGDAVYTMILYGREKGKPAVGKIIESDTVVGKRGIFPMEEALKYKFGARFVQALKEHGGWEAVNNAFTSYPPAGTAYLLHPKKYFVRLRVISPYVMVPPANTYFSDTYGEIDLLYYLLDLNQDEVRAKKAADGWAGGILLKSEPENIIAIKWRSERDIAEFRELLTEALDKKYGPSSPCGRYAQRWACDGQTAIVLETYLSARTTVVTISNE